MRTSGPWLRRLAWAVAGGAVGFALGAWDRIDVGAEVSVTDVLDVAATIVLTILVALLGQKRFSEDRAEKDLLIATTRASVEAARHALGVLRVSHQQQKPDLEATNQSLDDLGAALLELRTMLSEAGHNEAFAEADAVYHKLFPALRRSMSGGDFPAPYSAEVYYQGKGQADELVRRLRKLVFVINRR
ncbi:MAG: hypothetical protein AAF624_00570 [Bacteroidota bacterium]